MKKKVLGLMLCAAMAASMLVGCSTKTPGTGSSDSGTEAKSDAGSDSDEGGSADGSAKIGITIQNLKNDYWAGVMGKLEEMLKEKGYDYTLIDCEDNSATQISQIETVCGEALDAGIKVMCWDDPMENTTANWVLDNTALGNDIGKAAADFINEHYTADEPAEVCVIGYPATKVLLERQNGIEAGLEENCDEGNFEIVAEIDGLVANEAQANVETTLSAHPDCSVYVGVGAGAMIGANEALLQKFGGAGKIPENVGVITTDVTPQQLDSLEAGDEAVRSIVGFEGSSTDTAAACLEMFEKILAGDDFSGDNHEVYRPTSLITEENIADIQAGM